MADRLHPLPPLCPGRRIHPALQQIQAGADAVGDIHWLVQIDSTIVRAHQDAAAIGRKGGASGRTNRTITPSADPEEA
ncbi:hypothetical protein OHB14_58445 [Streptomyces sp. NBC_01613]|uniref:hypothetical protein n=1 Tax=Streptomyces sp. NBC_01613 TaxID=2975896 RepID=UPI00386A40E4